MSDTALIALVVVLFALAFSAMWLGIMALLGYAAGWPKLERFYPDRPEQPLKRLRFQSARMRGVGFNNCLDLEVCPTGLRIAMMRIFGPFRQPVFIPWGQIEARREKIGFVRAIRLDFDYAEGVSMAIREKSFWRIAEACPDDSLRRLAAELDRRQTGRR